MKLRFTIRDLLLVTAIIALAVGWWLDHRHFSGRLREIESRVKFIPKHLERIGDTVTAK